MLSVMGQRLNPFDLTARVLCVAATQHFQLRTALEHISEVVAK